MGGYAFRHISGSGSADWIGIYGAPQSGSNTYTPYYGNSSGMVFGGGVELDLWHMKVSPEFRNTTWLTGGLADNGSRGYRADSAKNQSKILVGIGWHRKSLPARIPLAEIQPGQEAVKLSTERKHLTNILKMVAYQIESDLVAQIHPFYARAEDEGRTFIQTALQSAAAIEPVGNELRVTVAPLSSRHRSQALAALCEILNQTNTQFPGINLTMRFSAEQSRDS